MLDHLILLFSFLIFHPFLGKHWLDLIIYPWKHLNCSPNLICSLNCWTFQFWLFSFLIFHLLGKHWLGSYKAFTLLTRWIFTYLIIWWSTETFLLIKFHFLFPPLNHTKLNSLKCTKAFMYLTFFNYLHCDFSRTLFQLFWLLITYNLSGRHTPFPICTLHLYVISHGQLLAQEFKILMQFFFFFLTDLQLLFLMDFHQYHIFHIL